MEQRNGSIVTARRSHRATCPEKLEFHRNSLFEFSPVARNCLPGDQKSTEATSPKAANGSVSAVGAKADSKLKPRDHPTRETKNSRRNDQRSRRNENSTILFWQPKTLINTVRFVKINSSGNLEIEIIRNYNQKLWEKNQNIMQVYQNTKI